MRAHAEISQYLKTHQTALEQQVDSWMEKYEKDVERKQHELDVLKTSKAKDLERLQELSKLVGVDRNQRTGCNCGSPAAAATSAGAHSCGNSIE